MPLYKIEDYNANYQELFENEDVLTFDLYNGNGRIGAIDDLLVDEDGKFRYFVVKIGALIFSKRILLPIGLGHISFQDRRVYVDGLTRDQVEHLPEYKDSMTVDSDYEESVRGAYRSATSTQSQTTQMNQGNYAYSQNPDLYEVNEQNHQKLKLYEERLIADKNRQKTGEVIVGKTVETMPAHAEVELEKERVIVEEVDTEKTPVTPGEDAFQEQEVVRMEVYEETPEINKETFVSKEVNVRKEVTQTTATAQDQIRRERLDVKTQGHPAMDKKQKPVDEKEKV